MSNQKGLRTNSRQTVFFKEETKRIILKKTENGKRVSTVINDVFRRFEALCNAIELPTFSRQEVKKMGMLMTSDVIISAESGDGLLAAKIKRLVANHLTGEMSKEDANLVAKLQKLTLIEQILLLELLGF